MHGAPFAPTSHPPFLPPLPACLPRRAHAQSLPYQAAKYRERLSKRPLVPGIGLTKERLDVHAVYLPEMAINIEEEAARLKTILDRGDNVNIFISEGAPNHARTPMRRVHS